jgi:hypothetical protein
MVLRPRDAAKPHQLQASDEMVRRLQCATLLKPGRGKTMATLDAIARLRAEGKCKHGLVVAPHQVVESEVWSREARQWAHLCHLSVMEIKGDEDTRELLLMLGADIEVISYHNFMWLSEAVRWQRRGRERYDFVIYDEVQKMKHPGTKRFKRAKAWFANVPVKLGLTGSPLGNHWQDIWGELHVLAGDKPLGPTKENFLDTYFKQIPTGGVTPRWEIRTDGSADAIRTRIRPYAFSINAPLPPGVEPTVMVKEVRLDLPAKVKLMEQRLKVELEVELDSGKTLMALTNSKLAMMVRQFASGALYTDEESKAWEEIHDVKLEAVADVIDELQGEPLLVFTWFKHEAARLMKKFPGAKILKGDTETVDAWNAKKIPLLIAHPQGSGLGLNLQQGGSTIVWFTLPWSRELFDQGNGREARMGQPDPTVSSIILLAGAIDRRVWSAVQRKGEDEALLMKSVELGG